MATKKICDICGKDAVDTVEVKSVTMTNLTKDLCEVHLSEIKQYHQKFFQINPEEPVAQSK